MQDIFFDFVEYIRSLLGPWGLGDYAGFIALIPFFLILYFLYLIVIRSIRISFKKVGMPREAIGGTIFGVRLFFFSVSLLVLLSTIGESISQYVVAGGALIGTALGLAFSRALSNIVSGFYVLVARPFRVGDYIRLGETEGIVLEITLNYTRVLRTDHTRQFVPNSTTIDSRLTNFRIRIDDYFDERGMQYHREIFDPDDDNDSKFQNAVEKLKFLTRGDEVYRYTFDIEVERTCSQPKIKEFFSSICTKWSESFILPPEYFFWSNTATTMTYRFAFIVLDPKDIFDMGQTFRSELTAYPEA
ncbi:MAG: mechanosensitive ion channel domain-containing protein [Candidatus Thorarchaeota archaeon]